MKKFIPIASIEDQVGFKKSYIYRLIAEGKFPKPYKFDRASRWNQAEINAWIEQAIETRRVKS